MKTQLLVLPLLLAAVPAAAQVNPFWSNRTGPRLSQSDQDKLLSSIDQLNHATDLHVGSKQSWSDPTSGNHGTNSVARIFQSGGLQCHLLHHEISMKGRAAPRVYNLTWCLTPDGEWKIKQ
ncbi:MAG TPA: hypothetical protein VIZ17_20805 [Acetobacteraceae bacterium]